MGTRQQIDDLVERFDDGQGDVVVIDASTLLILEVSAGAPDIIGGTRADLVGVMALDLIHPDDQLRAAEAVGEVVEYDGPRPPGMYRLTTSEGYRSFAISAVPVTDGDLDVIVYTIRHLDERHRAEALAADQVELMEMRSHRAPLDACLSALVQLAERHADGLQCSITVLPSGAVLPNATGRTGRGFVVAGTGIDSAFVEQRSSLTGDALPEALQSCFERGELTVMDPRRDPEPFAHAAHEHFGRCITSPLIGRSGELVGFVEGFDEKDSNPTHPEWNLHSLVARLAALFLDQVRFEQQLEAAAHTDPLTGLANRRKLSSEMDRLAEGDRSYAVAMVDLDQFSWINNNFGHHEGDRLLIEAARRLEQALDVRSIVARPAGDEFVVCIPDVADRSEALRLGSLILQALQAPLDDEHDSPGFRHRGIRASIGLALADGGESVERVLSAADAAMYVAKRSGGDAVHCPDAKAGGRARHRHDMRRSLARAIEEHELHLVLQPLVDIQTGGFHSAEFLVRWAADGQIVATPDEFVAVAEETDLILALDEWVLAEAGRQLAQLDELDLLPPGGRVWVNLSPRTVQQAGLTEMLRTHVPSELRLRFGIEVTERAVETDPALLAKSLTEVRVAGFAIALDDFGTGFGSLLQLAELPATDLKIDGTFVAKMLDQPVYATLVESAITLAHRLHMSVTAEAIESIEQWHRLRDLGCVLGQGFFFGAPMPIAQLIRWIQSPSRRALEVRSPHSP